MGFSAPVVSGAPSQNLFALSKSQKGYRYCGLDIEKERPTAVIRRSQSAGMNSWKLADFNRAT
jgi:hypothetical protein